MGPVTCGAPLTNPAPPHPAHTPPTATPPAETDAAPQPPHHRHLQLGFACVLGILRIGLPQQHRRRQSTARRTVVRDSVDSLARSQARALAVTDAVTLAAPDAAALTRPARRRPVHAAGRAPPRIVQ